MKKEETLNRVELEMNEWRLKEIRFSKLFSTDLTKNNAWVREKVFHLERLHAKFSGSDDPEERMALRLLEQERKDLLKNLYPNAFERFLREFFFRPFISAAYADLERSQRKENDRLIHRQLNKAGFGDLIGKVRTGMHQGQPSFHVTVSQYATKDEKMHHNLHFSRNQQGIYSLEGFTSSLTNVHDAGKSRSCFFAVDDMASFKRADIFNLLSGRSIEKQGTWRQLDFSDKDTRGRYLIKTFGPEFGYDLKQALEDLPLNLDQLQIADLEDSLRKGNCELVTFFKEGHQVQYLIEASPQFKSLRIFTPQLQKISLNTALGIKNAVVNKPLQSMRQRHRMRNAEASRLKGVK